MLRKSGLWLKALITLLVVSPTLWAGYGDGPRINGCGENAGPKYPGPPAWLITRGQEPTLSSTGIPVSSVILTEKEEADILFMREEEKLARDAYLKMFERWSMPVFANIAAAEQNHMDAMAVLVVRFGLEDPVVKEGPVGTGVFTNPVLQPLYDDLVSDGLQNQSEALYVGAWIEERDMLDIQMAIENTDMDGVPNPEIVATYESLLCGSRNHVRAFVYQIEFKSDLGEYEAQIDITQEDQDGFASQEEYQAFLAAIIDSPREQCGR